MNFNRRRGAIATFITLGVLLTGLTVTLNITWILLNRARVVYLVLGIILFAVLVAGVVLNTVFLVREIRRNERQDSFLNAVTHELKTPIASIRLYLDTLEKRQLDEAQRKKFYAIMHADSDRLLATVEQVLKAGELGQRSRLQNRTLLDLEPLVADCISITRARHRLPPDAITLAPVSGGVKLRVNAIPEDLRTAILNLLDNAVKYSPPGLTTLSVRCTLSITKYTFVSLDIKDLGLGIPERELKRIFSRFYRIPGMYEVKIKGTGLGLFLVQNIAKQHGGSIKATSPGSKLGDYDDVDSTARKLITRASFIGYDVDMTMPTAAIHAGSVPLPAEWSQALGLDEGTKVALILENGRIILQPKLANSLDELRLKFASDRDVVAESQEERRQDKW